MKRLTSLFAIILFSAAAVFAQEAKPQVEYNSVREYKNRVFTIQNRDARTIASSIKLLGSGFKGSDLNVNTELRTITVRDFPENLAAMEDAIKRLDQPAPQAPDIDIKISVLIASKTPLPNATVPDDLAPVVKQLQSTLRYAHYGLMTASMHRTKIGDGIEGSGVAEPTLLGMVASQERPIFYSYNLHRITSVTSDRSTIDIERFVFSMRVPLDIGGGSIQYQSVGFETPVSVRQGEKVVIGTTTMRDKALIVVVTAGVN
jgi:hypothetical protein